MKQPNFVRDNEMPLQNRMDPEGCIHITPSRGTVMGNRGGRIHDPETKKLTNRRWANKAWIICVTEFNNRQRTLMGYSYTELFFLDEVTALAAGHRPCFECRRRAAKAYQSAWQSAERLLEAPKVGVMDPILHAERLNGKVQRHHTIHKSDIIDGVVLLHKGKLYAAKDGKLLRWSFEGYEKPQFNIDDLPEICTSLTPPASVNALCYGYQPIWHPSAI